MKEGVTADCRRRRRPCEGVPCIAVRIDVFTQVPHAFGWLTEQKPLATVVIGGLISATLLTLAVLPALYMRYGRVGEREQAAEVVAPGPAE